MPKRPPRSGHIRIVKIDGKDPDLSNKIARAYIVRGFKVVPVKLGTKVPIHKGWEKMEITEGNVDEYFPKGERLNIGVQLGPLSNDLSDVDLDALEAVLLAPYFLPATEAVFGRLGKQSSHWLYYIHDAVGAAKAVIQLKDENAGVIVELRLGLGAKGAQTVFPGSIHTSGEVIEWNSDGDPADVTFGDMLTATKRLAAAALILRSWPSQGSRHTCAFIVGAFLARAGLEDEEIKHMVHAIATEAGDDEVADRVNAALSSATNTRNGENTYGLPKMIELFGEKRADIIAKHLDYRGVDEDETLERMNEEWCILPIGGKVFCMKYVEREGRRVVNMYRPDEFKTLLNNVKVGKAGKGTWWLAQQQRRQYRGLVFKPGQPTVIDGDLNMWQGWGIAPKEGIWKLMHTHIKDVLADGDKMAFDYIVKWTAWAFQNPGTRAEVALVLQGCKGAGKGVFGTAIKRAFGQHGLQISNLDHLTGKFNYHLMDCALLFADEAWWPGAKAAEGTLKRMLTEGTLLVEPKGANVFEADNVLHIIMAANADWIVPATHDERRYAVFHVSDHVARNEKYFAALYGEVESGGIAAMMFDLLKMDLKGWHPRRSVPHTVAFREQQILSLTSFQQYWYGLLQGGGVPMLDKRCMVPSNALYEKVREHSPSLRFTSYTALAEMFKKVGCSMCRFNPTTRGLLLPTLAEARAAWDKLFPGTAWNDVTDWFKEDNYM